MFLVGLFRRTTGVVVVVVSLLCMVFLVEEESLFLFLYNFLLPLDFLGNPPPLEYILL